MIKIGRTVEIQSDIVNIRKGEHLYSHYIFTVFAYFLYFLIFIFKSQRKNSMFTG